MEHPQSMNDSIPSRVLPLALFLFLFSIYLLTYSPQFHSSDGLAMFATAESLVRRGEWDADQIRWMGLGQGILGTDGHLYIRKGIGVSLLALPLVWLGMIMPIWGAATTSLLFNALITLRDALAGNDRDLIDHVSRSIDGAQNLLLDARADAGGRINRLEMAETRLAEEKIRFQEARSAEQDVDLAEAILTYQQDQLRLQAALNTLGTITQQSLLDFLR